MGDSPATLSSKALCQQLPFSVLEGDDEMSFAEQEALCFGLVFFFPMRANGSNLVENERPG